MAMPITLWLLATLLSSSSSFVFPSSSFLPRHANISVRGGTRVDTASAPVSLKAMASNELSGIAQGPTQEQIFEEFSEFLISVQDKLIVKLEEADGSGKKFSKDPWGRFESPPETETSGGGMNSGGVTRVLQGGDVVEKGACSLTVIRDGTLTSDRAATIRGRQINDSLVIMEGDTYSAAALSVVLHSRNPMVPTFRSDVRIFLVKSSSGGQSAAWFGGGSDLTPYYLYDDDIIEFHTKLKGMCDSHFPDMYNEMKKSCDEYFYLPARSEHRGTGGIFFDDFDASDETMAFVTDVVKGWLPSWLPIVERRSKLAYTEEQRQWQCLRRGRYLEFNLLYDRGVKFGLANTNPRVEGVMVSAPPVIAFDYNHMPKKGSEEERLVAVLKVPINWIA